MSIQNEFSSFKLLLKQVYSAHTTKIKELENEIKTLKEKLTEKEREINNNLLDCKRCVELEEAFKSCKKVLHDQSKLFENFGQKFSIFSSPEFGSQELKSAPKSPNCSSETARFSRNLKNNALFWNKNESSIISLGEDTITENKVNNASKILVGANNQNLLKKVMGDNGNLESFDAYTVTFPENIKHENFNSKSDSLILAPDSLDTSLDIKKDCLPKEQHSKWSKSKKISNSNGNEKLKQIERNCSETKVSSKRLSDSVDEENEERAKRCNTGNQVETCLNATRTEDTKVCDLQVPKIVVSNEVSKKVEVKSKTALKNSNTQNGQVAKKKITGNEVIESKDSKNETPKNIVSNITTDLKSKFSSHEISPSLLPTNANALPKIVDLESTSNDIDDFQEFAPIGKPAQSEDSWDSCDKKRFSKKNRSIKSIKCSSKFKMTLDAPPLNYKKPNLKQTKLSKSLFKTKEVHLNEKSPSPKQNEEELDLEMIEDNSFPTVLQDHFQTSTQCPTTKSLGTVDIDATFIPENFKFESSPCVTSNVKKNAVEKSNFKNGGLFSNISFPDELKLSTKDSHGKENDIDHSSSEDAELKENMNSFDRLPVPEEPNYKYKNDVVRKKSERKQLNAFECKECEKYYSGLGLTDKEKKERMKKCSRHRGKFTPPHTPDHFWELDFPDTEECKARGYMNETQKVKLNNICNI